jgi:single-stranded-DNA-specific exonuclease
MSDQLASFIADSRKAFSKALAAGRRDVPLLVVTHNDADGLSSAALLIRAFDRAGRAATVRILGRGENPWSEPVVSELRAVNTGGIIVADLGARSDVVRSDVPVVVMDHHVRVVGEPPEGTTLISGYGIEPTPSTSLIAWWCAHEIADVDDLLWLAAVGLVGDLGEKAAFDELHDARARFGATAIKETVALVNAPRRTARGDATPALRALLTAEGPKAIARGQAEGAEAMAAARAEVKRELEAARRVAPLFAGEVALIRLHSACQVHPLVAQSWRGRLRDRIVVAANSGYRPGWIHFAVRSATGQNLIRFLADHAPSGADAHQYGQGHEQATGGALRPEAWAEFLTRLGFEPRSAV